MHALVKLCQNTIIIFSTFEVWFQRVKRLSSKLRVKLTKNSPVWNWGGLSNMLPKWLIKSRHTAKLWMRWSDMHKCSIGRGSIYAWHTSSMPWMLDLISVVTGDRGSIYIRSYSEKEQVWEWFQSTSTCQLLCCRSNSGQNCTQNGMVGVQGGGRVDLTQIRLGLYCQSNRIR